MTLEHWLPDCSGEWLGSIDPDRITCSGCGRGYHRSPEILDAAMASNALGWMLRSLEAAGRDIIRAEEDARRHRDPLGGGGPDPWED